MLYLWMTGGIYMFSLLAIAVTSSWAIFAEGAMLGATVYAVGKGVSKLK